MCSDTKGRIAEAVEEMMLTKPVSKITIGSIMEQTQMKRQTFYYHYQDIYSVLEWIVECQLCTPLQYDETMDPEEWCRQALTLLRAKQPLLRQLSPALGREKLYRLTGGILRPQLSRYLPISQEQDPENFELALDMLCYAVFCTLDSLVVSRTPLNVDACAKYLRALFSTMQKAG